MLIGSIIGAFTGGVVGLFNYDLAMGQEEERAARRFGTLLTLIVLAVGAAIGASIESS